MHKNPEAKPFCPAISEQESSQVRILNKVLINKIINNKSRLKLFILFIYLGFLILKNIYMVHPMILYGAEVKAKKLFT